MPASKVYELEQVGKRFGYRPALEEVSFSVEEGDFVLLLGNNGAGKTTLLRILSTLMRPSSGRVLFRGEPMERTAQSARSSLGMISHESRFYLDLTARENLHVFGKLYGVANLRARIARVLEEVRLEGAPNIPVRGYSSGMLKRLSIARFLLYQPKVLLLDEPYSGLDLDSLGLLDQFLEEFRNQGGTTVMVTHQFTGGVGLATRIVLLQRGRLVYNQSVSGVTPEKCADLLRQNHSPA